MTPRIDGFGDFEHFHDKRPARLHLRRKRGGIDFTWRYGALEQSARIAFMASAPGALKKVTKRPRLLLLTRSFPA
jgi:hypothetical protein